MGEYMMIKTEDVMGEYVLVFCGMFESKETAQEYVDFEGRYYLIPADQLFWGDNPNLAINKPPHPKDSQSEG